MERQALIELKLQMGLDPSVEIDPHELRAMWRQLCRERPHARRAPAADLPPTVHATHLALFND